MILYDSPKLPFLNWDLLKTLDWFIGSLLFLGNLHLILILEWFQENNVQRL